MVRFEPVRSKIDDAGTYFGYAGGEFGASVDISMPYVAVGAPASGGANQASPDGSGRVFTYKQVGTGNRWDGFGHRIVPRNGVTSTSTPNAHFGSAVALDGSLLVAGAPDEAVSVENSAGRAYIYSRNGSVNDRLTNSTIAVDATLGPDGPTAGAVFGSSVDVVEGSPSWVAVGAPGAIELGGSTVGAGAVFLFDDLGAYQAGFTPSGGAGVQGFGNDLALSISGANGEVVVGASLSNFLATTAGHGFVFSNVPGSWVETARFTGPATVGGDEFGTSIAVSPTGRISVGDATHTVTAYE